MINYIYFIFICFLSLPCYPQSKINIIFRIDDYGYDNNPDFYPFLFKIFNKYNFMINVGVTPFKDINGEETGLNLHEKEILFSGLDTGIIEISQHGYTHANYNIAKGFRNEFKGWSYDIQYNKILKGKTYLENVFNVSVNTFIPPYNLYDNTTINVLDSLNFKILSATLYNAPEVYNKSLTFAPFTTTIIDLLKTLIIISNSNIKHDVLIVVMLHDYEFVENHKHSYNRYLPYSIVNKTSLRELDSTLSFIANQDNIIVTSFNNLSMNSELLTDTFLILILKNIYLAYQNFYNLAIQDISR
jgi:peptidoglycan/xylan/chitin deacetylase (PgdA/CDA1 family)